MNRDRDRDRGGEFVTLSTQPTVVGIRHSLHSTTCGCWLHSTQPTVVGYTLQPAVVGGGGRGFSRIEFLRMNHFPSVYVRFRFSTYPVIHYFSMLDLDLALTLLSTISLC